MAGAIYLGGGGSEDDEALLWDELFIPGQRVTVWPFALRQASARSAAARWLSGALATRGHFELDVWLDDDHGGDLQTSDVLAIPGGNAFDLLAHLRGRGLLARLIDFHAAGGRIYGGSAGAVLLGADTSIAADVDANDAAVTDAAGLDLLSGVVVRPHYDAGQRGSLQAYAADRGVAVLALPERSGVVVDAGTARCTGPDDVHVLTAEAHHVHRSGSAWPLARSALPGGGADRAG